MQSLWDLIPYNLLGWFFGETVDLFDVRSSETGIVLRYAKYIYTYITKSCSALTQAIENSSR